LDPYIFLYSSLKPRAHIPQPYNKTTGKVVYIQESFERFMDSPYYSKLELCGGAVMASFLKYLHWQTIHLLQYFTHFSKTCCRPFAASFRRIVEQVVFLPWSSLFMVGKAQKLYGVRSGLHRLDG